ncbi:alpha/beta fold hydrolase [Streptomyces sp. SID8366]|uniref:alpha/beta fold hydrolase n=2 Tax=unclassified Streptomyces TaxID=2593676 RepID=UPI000DB99E79|nr:alpha/beta fold hydrolase [Streptomyces sp. PsTaAH-130]MYU07353.1 alpha/beta fold hydrolase [Streptomyces sp. SID8366]MYU65855.1 alpha/beta fold hydrolase [Streptomyces sp. SID69]
MERGPMEQGAQAGSALRLRHLPRQPTAAVIALHGGRADSYEAARPWQLAALRMRPVLRAAASGVPPDETALGHVRYRHRGWNPEEDPLYDAYRALEELGRLIGPVPVVLIGHSMGGRAALRAAAHPAVRGVVALAPWLPEGEGIEHLEGTRAVILHGERDRVTSARASMDYVRRAQAARVDAGIILIRDGDHAMLTRPALWHRTIAELVADLLGPGERPSGLAAASSRPGSPLRL